MKIHLKLLNSLSDVFVTEIRNQLRIKFFYSLFATSNEENFSRTKNKNFPNLHTRSCNERKGFLNNLQTVVSKN